MHIADSFIRWRKSCAKFYSIFQPSGVSACLVWTLLVLPKGGIHHHINRIWPCRKHVDGKPQKAVCHNFMSVWRLREQKRGKLIVADPIQFIQIQIRIQVTLKDRIRIRLRYVFDVEPNKKYVWHFLTKSKHLGHLKSKKKNILTKLYFRQFNKTRNLELHGSFCG